MRSLSVAAVPFRSAAAAGLPVASALPVVAPSVAGSASVTTMGKGAYVALKAAVTLETNLVAIVTLSMGERAIQHSFILFTKALVSSVFVET